MAATFISGTDGDVTLPSGVGGVPFKFSMKAAMRTKDVSAYGGGRVSQHRGGLIDFSGSVGVFFQSGAAGTAPGLTSAGAFSPDGASGTLTAMTGCTYTGAMIMTDGSLDSAIDDPAIGGAWNFKFSGAVTETWAVGGA